MEQMKKISEQTLVPVSMVLILFGFISWLTTLYNETKANGSEISEIKSEQRIYNQKLDRIMEKLNVMEGVMRGEHDHEGNH